MKSKILSLAILILTSNFVIAQSSLQVSFKDCKSDWEVDFTPEIKLYRNGKLFKVLEGEIGSVASFNKLRYGEYRLDYRTIFNQIKSTYMELSKKESYNLDLCIDYFDHESDSTETIIEQLQEDEFYTINVSYGGCFGPVRKDSFKIAKNNNEYSIKYGEIEKTLTKNEIETVRKFEIELNQMADNGGCTSYASYRLKYGNRTTQITDQSCRWGGAYLLKKSLNLLTEEEN